MEAMVANPSHSMVTNAKPSRGRSSRLYFRVRNQTSDDSKTVISPVLLNAQKAPSSCTYDIALGKNSMKAKNSPSLERIWMVGIIFCIIQHKVQAALCASSKAACTFKTNQVKSGFCHIPRTYRKPNSSGGDKARQNLLFAVFVATIPLLCCLSRLLHI